MDDTTIDATINLFRVLTHPARLAILDVLRNGEQCVCHLEAVLGLRQAYVSQQLAVLRAAGLVRDHRDGLNNFYRVVKPEIYGLIDTARTLVGCTLLHRGLPAADCPCPRCASVVAEVRS